MWWKVGIQLFQHIFSFFLFAVLPNENNLCCRVALAHGSQGQEFYRTFFLGQWHFLAVTFTKTSSQIDFTMSLDGDQWSAKNKTPGIDSGIDQFTLGSGHMTLDELMIFNRVLSTQEIRDIHSR